MVTESIRPLKTRTAGAARARTEGYVDVAISVSPESLQPSLHSRPLQVLQLSATIGVSPTQRPLRSLHPTLAAVRAGYLRR